MSTLPPLPLLPLPPTTAPAPAKAPEAAPAGPAIEAPLNGTFYRSSAPGKPPLAEEGQEIKAGTTVCIVEAMKLFNEIKAPCDCKLGKALVEHGKPVKKGTALFSYTKIG